MSTHLLIAAAYLEDLPQGTKLVLMAAADSGDEHTREAAPGLPKLRAWSGLGKSQCLAVVAQLVTLGLLERVEAGRAGRRAVYRVFPAGVPAIPHPTEVAARYETGSGVADPNELSTGTPSTSQQGPAHRTLRVRPDGIRVLPAGPLQSSTSVSRPPAGFPGSRATAAQERDVAARARGARNVPCPLHPDEVLPCPQCAAAAASPEARDAAASQARRALRQPPTEGTA